MDRLRNCLERYIVKVTLIPLFSHRYEFDTIDAAIKSINSIDIRNPNGVFTRFEVIIDYNNNDTIRATFQNKAALTDFMRKIGS